MRRPSATHAAVALAALAFALRLLDPLSTPVLPAEDPIIHVYRAERLATKGVWPVEYPAGFPALLVAAKAWGLPLMGLARFAPSVLGAVAVLAMFAVARRLGGDVAGLGAALLYAATPEVIRRTTLLAPAALDLVLAPLLLWWMLDLDDSKAAAIVPLALVGLWLWVAHPWGLAYLLLALAPVGLGAVVCARKRWVRPAVALGVVAAAVPLVFFLKRPLAVFHERVLAWVDAPSLAWTPPRFTEPLDMLGLPLMALAVLGALRGPGSLRLVGLTWTLLLLPLAVFDITGKDYVPYRTVAFIAPGLALLGGAAVGWAWDRTEAWRSRPRRRGLARAAAAPAFAAVLVLAVTAPAVAMEPWYRIHSQAEYEALEEASNRPWTKTVAGSWQAAAVATAFGADARVDREFFRDQKVRAQVAAEVWPFEVVVVVDGPLRALAQPDIPPRERVDLAFLEGAVPVAEGGNVTVLAWRP